MRKPAPTIVLVILVFLKLKYSDLPSVPSFAIANTLACIQAAPKSLKHNMMPNIVDGIRINQPIFLNLFGTNSLFDIIKALTNVRYILHLDSYYLHFVIDT